MKNFAFFAIIVIVLCLVEVSTSLTISLYPSSLTAEAFQRQKISTIKAASAHHQNHRETSIFDSKLLKTSLALSPLDTPLSSFKEIMESNGYLADMLTVFGTTTLSDFIAQTAERSQQALKADGIPFVFDAARLKRFALFGFFDGAVGHTWFQLLDKYITGSDTTAIIQKVIADTSLFTPFWCLWFVIGMAIIKRNFDFVGALKSEYKELLAIDVGFFLPLSCIVYSVVPLHARVTFFAVASVLYTTLVSLWNEQKKLKGESAGESARESSK